MFQGQFTMSTPPPSQNPSPTPWLASLESAGLCPWENCEKYNLKSCTLRHFDLILFHWISECEVYTFCRRSWCGDMYFHMKLKEGYAFFEHKCIRYKFITEKKLGKFWELRGVPNWLQLVTWVLIFLEQPPHYSEILNTLSLQYFESILIKTLASTVRQCLTDTYTSGRWLSLCK